MVASALPITLYKYPLARSQLAMIEFPSQSGVGVSVPSEPEAALARALTHLCRLNDSCELYCQIRFALVSSSTAGDILELAVFFSVKAGDSGAFERAVTQLKQFYGQTRCDNAGLVQAAFHRATSPSTRECYQG